MNEPLNAKAYRTALQTALRESSPSTDPSIPEPASTSGLAKFWLAGAAAWGHKFTSYMGDLPVDDDGRLTVAGHLWANGLAGFSEAQILGTLSYYVEIGAIWPPNLPQVRKHCAGIPELTRVRQELLGREPKRSGFARLVWSYLDTYQLARVDQDKADRMVREAYDLAVENLLSGRAQVPEDSPAVTQQEPEPRARPQGLAPAKVYIEGTSEILGASEPKGTVQDELAELERQSEPDFRQRAAGPDA